MGAKKNFKFFLPKNYLTTSVNSRMWEFYVSEGTSLSFGRGC